MGYHSSHVPVSVRFLDVLLTAGILSGTTYLFWDRYQTTSEAMLANIKPAADLLETADKIKSAFTLTPEIAPVAPPPVQPQEDAPPAAIVPEPEPEIAQPVKKKPVVKAKPVVKPAPAKPVEPEPVQNNNSAYQPRGFNSRGFNRRGFNAR